MFRKKQELGIGIIGSGNFNNNWSAGRGQYLAGIVHQPEKGVKVVAVADAHQPFLKQFTDKFGSMFTTTDHKRLLARNDVNAVFICTPDNFHEEHAVDALNAGKAVYLEKPMAITTEGADRILEAAADTNGKLYVGHNMRHMGFVLEMKRLIDEGHIGEVKTAWCQHFVGHGGDFYFKDWHADQRNTNSLLLQKGSHDIDILHWLCGGYTASVNARGKLAVYGTIEDRNLNIQPSEKHWDLENYPPLSQTGLNPVTDVEDESLVHLVLDNGVLCSYNQCHFSPNYCRNYTFIGTEGSIGNDGNDENAVIYLWNKRGNCGEPNSIFPVKNKQGGHGGADPNIVQEFIDFVREDKTPTTSPVAARYSVAAGDAATKSLRNNGTPVDVPLLEERLVSHFVK
ncbi:MAG: Gfo/Idh/MocA family oxidoreductase [bacterium]|nr:Gfo/Idh/MocA family oxidoreductase [bacterium]